MKLKSNTIVFRNDYHDRHFRRQSRREDMYVPFVAENDSSASYMRLSIAASLVIMTLAVFLLVSN